jgi:hypothetical protein
LGIEGNEKKPKLRGGCYEREKQRAERKQEGAAVEPQGEEEAEEGEEEQVKFCASI